MKQLEKLVCNQLSELDLNFKSKKYLLAVSGGSDSICLTHVFHQLNLNFEIAHCNFNLRGEESDGDEQFVRTVSDDLKIKGNFTHFKTKEIARKNKNSIQEEARVLRYNWFKQLAKENDFDFIITAHHQDDLIETFFINTVRGTGVKGLRGIPVLVENIIRPLLFVPKTIIEDYIKCNNILYRSDSSNKSLKYSRNYLRHKTIPELENVHQNAKKGIVKTIKNIINTESYLELKLKEDRDKYVKETTGGIVIESAGSLPYFFLLDVVFNYGFNNVQLDNVLNSNQSGSQVYNESFTMFVKNNCLFILKSNVLDKKEYIFNNQGVYNEPIKLVIEEHSHSKLDFSDNVAYFDADLVKFPFILRKWRAGDVFFPFGMKGKKKLSDYFVDIKLSRFEKEKVWVLESQNKICWVVGKRSDNRFKVTNKTTKIIKIVT